ncbi:hypothetical protein BA917_05385 [Helicobacter pullorum]|uniref:GGDEF domain-containing protein n=1 Tax=Helicobacter pullorum TaxID=35818 RepID=UPI000816857D|nr:diguanylate cyclase [Helicobacter pullorum]OCR20375.1 hypothetical protein BA917_05385 [Helicobacter pullorum]
MKDDFGAFAELPNFETDGIEKEKLPNIENIPSFASSPQPLENQPLQENATPKSDSLETYGEQIIQTMLANKIFPSPYNYKIYFEKLLEDKPQDFKNNAMRFLEIESTPSEKQISLENKIIKAQSCMVNTLQLISAVFSNFQLLQNILKKHAREIESVNNVNMLQNVITIFEKELGKVGDLSRKQLQEIKSSYNKTTQAIESINNEIICDSRYGIYNKHFLNAKLQSECEEITIDKHKSSLIMIKVAKNLAKKVTSEKNATLINKTITKILTKNCNKSDTLAYCGEGIFGILISHGDKKFAQRFANRLSEKISTTNVFLGEEELSLNICSGICEIQTNQNPKTILKNALDALKKASNNNLSFATYGEN